jgi:hypothetical protein
VDQNGVSRRRVIFGFVLNKSALSRASAFADFNSADLLVAPSCHVVAFLTRRSFSEGGSEDGSLDVGGTI